MSFLIREAQREDASAMSAVLIASITELCHADHGDDREKIADWTANKTPAGILDMLAREDLFVVVVERDGQVVAVGATTASGEVALNYVAPEALFPASARRSWPIWKLTSWRAVLLRAGSRLPALQRPSILPGAGLPTPRRTAVQPALPCTSGSLPSREFGLHLRDRSRLDGIIGGAPLGRGPQGRGLERQIARLQFGAGTKGIAKAQVGHPAFRAEFDHMQQMGAFTPVPPPSENVVAGNTGILGIVIAQRQERVVALCPAVQRTDADENVQDGFCRQARHRGGAIMLYAEGDACKGQDKSSAFPLELRRPARIVGHEPVVVMTKAEGSLLHA